MKQTLNEGTFPQAINLVQSIEARYELLGDKEEQHFLVKHKLAKMAVPHQLTFDDRLDVLNDASAHDLLRALKTKKVNLYNMTDICDVMQKAVDDMQWYAEFLDDARAFRDTFNNLKQEMDWAINEINDHIANERGEA